MQTYAKSRIIVRFDRIITELWAFECLLVQTVVPSLQVGVFKQNRRVNRYHAKMRRSKIDIDRIAHFKTSILIKFEQKKVQIGNDQEMAQSER